ncbi:MAG: DUF4143 domain-containing protein [Legionellaceae bacterium]|nr:DUF4143 domain-containing protein [Legionellaceae bacterium]
MDHFYYYRDKDQVEVDFILENHARKIIGIEVKASQTILNQDFRGLRKLASLTDKLTLRTHKCLPGI